MGMAGESSEKAREGIEVRQTPLRVEDDRSAVLLLIGVALALFAVCSVFGSASARVTGIAGVDSRFIVDTLLMACAFLCLVGLRFFARALSSPAGLRVLAILAFVGTVPCPFLFDTAAWPLGIPCVAAGSVALVFLWWSHACTVGRDRLAPIVAGAVGLAGALLAVSGLLPGSPQADYLSDMASLASCLLLLGVRNDLRDRLLRVSIAESRERRRNRMYSRLGELNYFSVGVILGVDGGLWLLLGGPAGLEGLFPPVLLMGAALALVGVFVGVACAVPRFDVERLTKDYLCATLALGYLLIPLVGGAALAVVYVYLIAVAFVQVCIVFLAGAELVRFEELSPLYSFSEAAYLVGGAVVGALAVLVLCLVAPGCALAASCAAVVVYAAVVQVQLNRVSFPEDWVDGDDPAPESAPSDDGLPPVAGERRDDAALASAEPSGCASDDKLIPAGSYLRRRLDEIGSHYGLSPRQCEILDLLARGRDTQYIMDRFTISRATAKTHVYNIYRKLDIHCRQDLYDLIEGEELATKETPGQGINPRV